MSVSGSSPLTPNTCSIQSRGGAPILGAAVVGITAVLGFGGFFAQRAHAERERHFIRLAHAQIDQFRVRMGGQARRVWRV